MMRPRYGDAMAKNKHEHKPDEVNEYMDKLDHPFKAEVQAIREIITGVHPGITEQIKWVAPSFSYKDYLATFNLRATEHVHLIFHNGAILNQNSGFLEGSYPDRRMMYFTSMDDVNSKRDVLEALILEWIMIMDAK